MNEVLELKRTAVKDPGEAVVLTFEFARELACGEKVQTVVSIDLSVFEGESSGDDLRTVDDPQIDGSKVLQMVELGLADTSYEAACWVTTTLGRKLVLAVVVPVEARA